MTTLAVPLAAVPRHRNMIAGGLAVGIVLVLAALAPWITPYDPVRLFTGHELSPPGPQFLLGTDALGRDVLSRVVVACRNAVQVDVLGVAVGALIGSVIGLLIGYFGGWLDNVVMRLTDIAFGFPEIIVGIVVVALTRPGLGAITWAIAAFNVPTFVRIMRGCALQLRNRPFVDAAVAAGLRDREIIARHVLPNSLPMFVIQVGLALPDAVLLDAGLSFIGLGAPPPAPTLGGMLSEASAVLDATWLAIVPGAALCLFVMGLNLLADGVRDVLDPGGR
ncbi:ABC transporter permease [Nonomuraea sediminis]|uniref:ABC transporter permease n=1 Tax=Nonomuraea sediminis TaxID=2835864 RepID=UPI001BDD8129|nr:ABC transporter permease [Nonomuraea sediminis]